MPRQWEPVGPTLTTAGPASPGSSRASRALRAISALAVVVGAALRLAGARGDLWMDEIWSLLFTRYAGSALGVFTRLHHDNNHHLNTLFMMLVGPGHTPAAYRALSVLAGAATVALCAARPLRRGALESAATATLLAFSYLLVHYGSEARGYSLAMVFAVTAYQAMDLYLRDRRARWAAVFAAAGVLGFLSHLTFAFPLAGLLAWAAVDLLRQRGTRAPAVSAALLSLPALALAALWAFDLRYLVVGRGPEYSVPGVLRELARAAHGAPRGATELLALVTLAAAAWEAAALARTRDSRIVFFAVAFLAPAGALAVRRPEFLAPRYFTVLVPFVFLLTAAALARLARTGRAGRLAAGGVLAVFVAVNGSALLRLFDVGRGQYAATVRLMLGASQSPAVTVGSDHDWRNLAVLQYQARRLSGGERIVYVPRASWSADGPEWYLQHDFSDQPAGTERVNGPNGRAYDRVAVFPYAGLSGWNWTLYRRSKTDRR